MWFVVAALALSAGCKYAGDVVSDARDDARHLFDANAIDARIYPDGPPLPDASLDGGAHSADAVLAPDAGVIDATVVDATVIDATVVDATAIDAAPGK